MTDEADSGPDPNAIRRHQRVKIVDEGIEREFYPPGGLSRTLGIVWRLKELDRVTTDRLRDLGRRRKVDDHGFFKIGCLINDLVDALYEGPVDQKELEKGLDSFGK